MLENYIESEIFLETFHKILSKCWQNVVTLQFFYTFFSVLELKMKHKFVFLSLHTCGFKF